MTDPGLFTLVDPRLVAGTSIRLPRETLVSKTTSFQRLGTAGLAVLTLVCLLSGCSSKKTASAASTASTGSTASAAAPAATSAAAPAAASPTISLPSPSKVVATGGGKFCQQVAAELNNSVVKEAATGGSADSLKQTVQGFQSIEGEVLEEAPTVIKPDLATLFGALDQVSAALAKDNYDITKLLDDPSVEAPLKSPAVLQAQQNVDAYMKNTCGIDTGGGDASAQAQASAAEESLLAQLSAAAAPSS